MSQRAYRRPATQQEIKQTLNEFLKMCGFDWSTVEVRKDFVKATCTKWKDQQLAKVSARSFNKKLSYIQHFFRWMVTHDQLEKNPLEGLSVAARQQKMESSVRKPFAMKQMRAIRDTLLKTRKKDAHFWGTVLVMHTGMRSGEAFPLCVDQVKEQDGIDFIDLHEDKERNLLLKNSNSARKVPLSSALLGLGFMDYVKTRRKVGPKARLFPALSRTWDLSMTIKRAMRKASISDPLLTLHSCRHFWATELMKAGVQLEIRHRLLGHALPGSAQNQTYVYMEDAFAVKVLDEAVEKVKF